MKWYNFDPSKGSYQKRPPIYRPVLVLLKSTSENLPNGIAVGYRKNAAGDKQSPYFVIPGIGGDVVAWSNLPLKFSTENEVAELWKAAVEQEAEKNGA